MKKAIVKLVVAGVVVVALSSVLAVTTVQARMRGKLSHCRNNLRHLGGMALREWDKMDAETASTCTGREFWQFVRIMKFRKVNGEWLPLDPDPFTCPVYGRTVSNKTEAAAIDYRGPKRVPYDDERDEPFFPGDGMLIGADREGNHPGGGGHVVFRDTRVSDVSLKEAGPDDPLWQRAAAELSD